MSRNNVKLLTDRQRIELKEKYYFEYEEGFVVVKLHDYGRITKHPDNKSFHINSPIRKVVFSLDAIRIWKELYADEKTRASLIDVQHAVNSLYVMYQPINTESVKKFMKDAIKVKKI